MMSESDALTFSILLVEDDKEMGLMLQGVLTRMFPRSVVDWEETVKAAERLLQEGRAYDLAILDFKLPSDKGHGVQVDTSLCRLLDKRSTPIIHITAYPDDPVITDHMKTAHQKESLERGLLRLIAKTAHDNWVQEMIAFIEPYHRKRINRKISECLGRVLNGAGEEMASNGDLCLRSSGPRPRCGTHDVAELCKAILEVRGLLNDDVKQRIASVFPVADLDADPPRLSLFRREDWK